MRGYGLLPHRLVTVVAALLPPIELACGILLALGIAGGLVSGLLACLLLAFAGALALNLARGRAPDCGCFGGSVPQRATWLSVARNAALAASAILVSTRPPTSLAVWPAWPPASAPSVPSSDASAVAVFAVSLFLVFLLVSEAFAMREAAKRFVAAEESSA